MKLVASCMLRILFLCFAATSGVEEQLPTTPTTAWDNVRASGELAYIIYINQ